MMDDDVYELPVSFPQRWIWLLDQIDPGSPAYLVPWRISLTGPVDRAALAAAFATVVERHEALRTTFRAVDGQPVQVIAPTEVPLCVAEVADADARVDALIREGIHLDLGPMLRATLLVLGPDRYELVLITHHIVFDGRSCALFFAELTAAYDAHARGVAPELPELPIQYGDFALWQIERWAGGGFEAAERFWAEALAGVPTTIDLPADHPRAASGPGRGATLDFAFDSEVAAGLRAVARAGGATMFMTLLAVYATVLARYTGRDDLLIGTPVAGRTRSETEPLIGLFVNTLPLRARLAGDPTFADLVHRLRAVTAGALAHQDLPFDRIVEIIQPAREQTVSPLVQVQFALEEPMAPARAGGVTFDPHVVTNGTTKFDLELGVVDTGDEITATLHYDANLFDPETIATMAGGLRAVARAVAADPEARVKDLDVIPDDVRERMTGWATGAELDAPGDPVALLTDALRGGATAVTATDGALSRDELVRWAGGIAAALRDAGVGPDSLVGLCVPRSTATVPAMLGTWMAGASYVPIDHHYPAQRVRMMVADSGVRVVLTHPSLAGVVHDLIGADVTVVDVDAARALAPMPPVAVSPDSLAYTIFTSGSTGRPKGVGVTRRGVDAMLRAFRLTIDLTEDDVAVAVTTLSFDIAVWELLYPLVRGGRVVIADADVATDGAMMHDLLVASAATVFQATPATWRMLVSSGGIPARVRVRLSGGEPVPADLLDALTGDGGEAWNGYGPTETAVYSAVGRIWPAPASVVVGPPVAGTRVYVLDATLRPVPPGVVGEIYIGGAGVARGYHARPALTAERFLPDPFSTTPGARLYRTGDLARWRSDGLLDLLGRADNQVKLRGFRIETGEIDTVLVQHPSVAHAMVTAYTPPGGSVPTNLVAYVVATSAPVDPPTLRRHLQAYLPDYMIPAIYVPLDAFPLTPNGKIDRSKLPEPQWGDASGAAHVPADTPTQRRLADIWAEILPEAAPISVSDDFFAIGGHSLTAIQMLGTVKTVFGVKVRFRTLMSNATIADLAAFIDGSLAEV
jgi:amino acid adenylation domain-containing protein